MKNVILLDMDGTLTPARKPIASEMCQFLDEALLREFHVGIVTGSKLEYMDEQLKPWINFKSSHDKVHIFPCNGMQYWHKNKLIYSREMKEEYSDFEWNWLIHDIESADKRMRLSVHGNKIRKPEQIIYHRGSMINWCPIGRDANHTEREEWIKLDKENYLRINFLNQVKTRPLFHMKTVIKLGGETSFDIFPTGWDKSYVFKNFQGADRIYFIGDRTDPMGNDYEGFRAAGEFGYATTGPEETGRIIREIFDR